MRFKIFTFILLMLSLSSCTQSFFYNRLDTLFNWYIDDYIELDQTQQQSFDAQLNKVLQWHRSEELNRYIQFLKQLKVDIKTPINRNMIDIWGEQTLIAYERVEEKMFNLFTTTVENLSQQQVDNLIEKLESLPWKYRFTMNIKSSLASFFEEQDDFQISEGFRIIKINEK